MTKQIRPLDDQWRTWLRDAGVPFEEVERCPNPMCLVCRPPVDEGVPAAA